MIEQWHEWTTNRGAALLERLVAHSKAE